MLRGAGFVGSASQVHGRDHAQGHAQARYAVHAPLQPPAAREQRDGRQRDGDLQHRGGLRPAVVLVHLRLALLVQRLRLGFQRLGLLLDVVLLQLVAVQLGLQLGLAAVRGQIACQLGHGLLGALGLVVGPLVGGLGLLDGGVVLDEAGIGLRGAAHVGEDGAHRGDDGRRHGDAVGHRAMVGIGGMGVLGGMLDRVVVRPMDVEAVGGHGVGSLESGGRGKGPGTARALQTATGALMAGWCS